MGTEFFKRKNKTLSLGNNDKTDQILFVLSNILEEIRLLNSSTTMNISLPNSNNVKELKDKFLVENKTFNPSINLDNSETTFKDTNNDNNSKIIEMSIPDLGKIWSKD